MHDLYAVHPLARQHSSYQFLVVARQVSELRCFIFIALFLHLTVCGLCIFRRLFSINRCQLSRKSIHSAEQLEHSRWLNSLAALGLDDSAMDALVVPDHCDGL